MNFNSNVVISSPSAIPEQNAPAENKKKDPESSIDVLHNAATSVKEAFSLRKVSISRQDNAKIVENTLEWTKDIIKNLKKGLGKGVEKGVTKARSISSSDVRQAVLNNLNQGVTKAKNLSLSGTRRAVLNGVENATNFVSSLVSPSNKVKNQTPALVQEMLKATRKRDNMSLSKKEPINKQGETPPEPNNIGTNKAVETNDVNPNKTAEPDNVDQNKAVQPNNTDRNKEASAAKAMQALKIVNEIKSLESTAKSLENTEGVKKVKIGEETFEVKFKEFTPMGSHGVTVKEVEINGEKFQIKEFDKNAYNGPKKQDFIDRRMSIYNTAANYMKNPDLKLPQEKIEAINKKLEKINEDYNERILALSDVDIKTMEGDEKAAEAYFSPICKAAENHIADFIADLVDLLQETDPTFDVDSLRKLEGKFVEEQGRPIIINIYSTDKQKYVSMQEPATRQDDQESSQTNKVIPSTIRYKDSLVNYVVTTFGKLDDNNNMKVLFQGIRHSTLSPIAIEDPHERRAIAAKCAKQDIIDTAVRTYGVEYLKNGTEDNPIPVSIHTMMLLTAKVGDYLRNHSSPINGKWIGASESMQLLEGAEAMNQYDGRTIKVTIGGKEVWLKPEFCVMNLGTNVAAAGIGVTGKIPTHDSQNDINAKGYAKFSQGVEEFLRQKGVTLPPEKRAITRAKLNIQNVVAENKNDLHELYAKKELLQEQYLSTENNNPKATEEELESVSVKINAIEQKINKAYRHLHSLNEKLHDEPRRASSIGGYNKLDAETRLVLQNYLRAKDLFLTKAYEKPETVMEFQTLFIEIENLMGNTVQFYCKSAKDRTGRENNIIEEREIFREESENKQYPIKKDDFDHINKYIAPIVGQSSSSLANTTANGLAPGLQIHLRVNPEGLLINSNRQVAVLAKTPYKLAKEKIAERDKLSNQERPIKPPRAATKIPRRPRARTIGELAKNRLNLGVRIGSKDGSKDG
jgi:hypothetical protein